jgi:hypothetical protein
MTDRKKRTPPNAPGRKHRRGKGRARKTQENDSSDEFVEGYRRALQDLAKAEMAKRRKSGEGGDYDGA